MSHYSLNSNLNKVVGNLPVTLQPGDPDNAATVSTIAERQLNLIVSEYEELVEGLKHTDIEQIRDGIADIIVTVDGFFYRLGLKYPNNHMQEAQQAFYSLDPTLSKEGKVSKIMDDMEHDLSILKNIVYTSDVPINALFPIEAMTGLLKDLLTKTCTLAMIFGIDVEADQQAVYDSNMSKFDNTLEEAQKTQAKYEALGVKTYVEEREGLFIVKVEETTTGTDGKVYPAGKFLKSIHFVEPSFPALEAGPL